MIIKNSSQITRNGGTEAGTLGGFFTFGGNEIFGISNNHVLANLNNCSTGDKICMSGSKIVIGSLQCWIELSNVINYLDIALFKLAPNVIPRWQMPLNKTVPGNIRAAFENEDVYMITNGNSIKEGKISQLFIEDKINFTLLNKPFIFTRLTEVESATNTPFSEPGESGSLVFSKENDDVLGVLIGTNRNNTSKSYYVPFKNGDFGISAIYNSLKVWNPYMNIT